MTTLSTPLSLLAGLLLFLYSNAMAMAHESDPSKLELTTERVIVFKDGYCLVVKQGIAQTDADGMVFTEEVPDAAILGSFWAVPEQGNIKSLVAGWEESESKTEREVNCTSVVEIIKANLGKTCYFEQGDQKFSGKLHKLLSNDGLPDLTTERASETQFPGHFAAASASPHSSSLLPQLNVSTVTGAYFLLRTESGDMMVSTSAVKNLLIDGMESKMIQTATRKTRHKRLSMKFAEADSNVKINLMYFRPDVRWIPTYRVNLTDNEFVGKTQKTENANASKIKTAEILMQSEILNEAEDFTDVPFHVVVGVPNFRFRSIPSPMVLESSLRNVLAQAAPDIMGNGSNRFSNALYAQRSSEFRSNRAAGDGARADVELPEELVSKSGNDLFVYQLEKMSLKKGERAMVPILRTEVAYRDIYTWDIQLTHAETYAASSADSTSPLVLSENKIWRQVELINDTDIPWTTGAAMFVDGFQPLAQELLTYTSPGGICRVPVTVSVDLRGRVEDSEVKRDLKALQWRGRNYARVDGKIASELANNKTESVDVQISLRFGGKSTGITPDGETSLGPYRAEDWRNQQGDQINNSCLVKWTATIEPGECFEPTVTYEFFLRH